jgi:hypothetical protein
VGNLKVVLFRKERFGDFRSVVVEVPVAASDGNAGPRRDDARTGDEAGIDVVAEVDGEEGERTDIANGGKAGLERLSGVDHAGNSGAEGRVLKLVDLLVAIGAIAQVGVAIDEAGENVLRGEIDDLGAGGRLESSGFNGLDALVCNNECDVVKIMAGCGFEKVASADVSGGSGRRLGLRTCAEN